MKRIGLIIHSLFYLGGTERVVITKFNYLSKIYDVKLISLYGNKDNIAYNINKSNEIYFLNNKKQKVRSILYNTLKKLKNIVKDKNISILFIEGRGNTFIPLFLKMLVKIKIVFCEHNSIAENKFIYNDTLKKRVCRKFDQYLINKFADTIVVLTEKEKKLYKSKYKMNKVINIYNILDDELLTKKSSYNISSKKFITVGRITYQKGYEYLVRVAKIVFQKYPDWEWHICGDGDIDYKNKIIDLINKNNLQNNIILLGNHSDIYDLYEKYSFLVMTSRYEGFGMVLLEAKTKKLPLVSFDIYSGPSDIIRDGIDGFLVKPFDCQKMADKICELIEKPELRQKFSDNAHGNIGKFNKEKIIKQWRDLIEKLSSNDS